MRVSVIGCGYVGLVTAACLAQTGHQVKCLDIDVDRVEQLRRGVCPIFEPGLEEVIANGLRDHTLSFTAEIEEACREVDVIIIAVGTPSGEDGSADTGYVLAAAGQIAAHLDQAAIVVVKSTVPVGTCDAVARRVAEGLGGRGVRFAVTVVSNPEFLKEGAAVNDFMKPDRIIVGTGDRQAIQRMRELYAPFNRNHDRMMFMDVRSAELTKYAANAMLATKISFINEIANIAELVNADIEKVRQGIGADPRIGHHFIYPGCGFGGSCFPKDVRALEATALDRNYRPRLLRAVREINDRQKQRLVEKVHDYFDGELRGRVFALWGLSFKPQTDDMRAAPSRVVMEALWRSGASVRAYDPQAMEACQAIYGDREGLSLLGTKEAAIKGADALIICTEWKGFWAPDFDYLVETLKTPVIFDGRNLFDPSLVTAKGLDYVGIGRSGQGQAMPGLRLQAGSNRNDSLSDKTAGPVPFQNPRSPTAPGIWGGPDQAA